MYLRLILILCTVNFVQQSSTQQPFVTNGDGRSLIPAAGDARSLKLFKFKSPVPYVRKLFSPVKLFFRPIIKKVNLFLEVIDWYAPEVELGSCFFEAATGIDPYVKAKSLAKNFLEMIFNQMREMLPVSQGPSYEPPAYEQSYPDAHPVYQTQSEYQHINVEPQPQLQHQPFAEYQHQPFTEYQLQPTHQLLPHYPNNQQTYIRRKDIHRKRPIIQSSQGYSKVSQTRSARLLWTEPPPEEEQEIKEDQYYEHFHKPVYIVHPPEPLYPEPPHYVEPSKTPQLLLNREWIDYFENLLLSKFGFVERLKANTYLRCTQSYTFSIILRVVTKIVSKLLF